MMSKVDKAFELFDAYNRKDPVSITIGSETYPAAYFYSTQVYNWIKKLEPAPEEALLLASRCQHIGRWEIPRSTYPQGRAGYLQWRKALARFHAETAASMLVEAGYEADIIDEVKAIILKNNIKSSHNTQVMENALCLVFLQFQYEDFIKDYDDSKMINILKKTWAKMSSPGREAALTLSFSDRGKRLIEQALGEK